MKLITWKLETNDFAAGEVITKSYFGGTRSHGFIIERNLLEYIVKARAFNETFAIVKAMSMAEAKQLCEDAIVREAR